MDDKEILVDHIVTDTGGQVHASSFGPRLAQNTEDILYIINRLNPLIEKVEGRGFSASKAPSGRMCVSRFQRIEQRGLRDVIFNHTFFLTEREFLDLGANPYQVRQFLDMPSEHIKDLKQAQLVARPRMARALLQAIGDEDVANDVLTAFLLSPTVDLPVCLISDGGESLFDSILDATPLPFRLTPFSTFVKEVDGTFRFSLTTRKQARQIDRSRCLVFDPEGVDSELPGALTQSKSFGLSKSLASVLLQAQSKLRVDTYDWSSFAPVYGAGRSQLLEVSMFVLSTFLRTLDKKSASDEALTHALVSLERSILEAKPSEAASLSFILYDKGRWDHVTELIEMSFGSKAPWTAEFSQAVFRTYLDNQDYAGLAQLLRSIRVQIEDKSNSEVILRRLLTLRPKGTEARDIVDCVEAIIGSTRITGETVSSFVLWADALRKEKYAQHLIPHILATTLQSNEEVRVKLLNTSVDRFIEILALLGSPEDVAAEVMVDSKIAPREKVRLLSGLLSMRKSIIPDVTLRAWLSDLFRRLSRFELVDSQVYDAIRFLDNKDRAEIELLWSSRWGEYAALPLEDAFASMILFVCGLDVEHSSSLALELDKYLLSRLTRRSPREARSSQTEGQTIELAKLSHKLQSPPQRERWETSGVRKALSDWVVGYWESKHPVGNNIRQFAGSAEDIIKDDILVVYNMLRIDGAAPKELADSAATNLERVATELSDGIWWFVAKNLPPELRYSFRRPIRTHDDGQISNG